MATTAPVTDSSNPALAQYVNQENQWSGDSAAALGGNSASQLNQLQQQQTQLLGNGGFGYVSGAGNDMSGSSYAAANPWAIAAPSQQTNPIQDQLQAEGGAASPGVTPASPTGSQAIMMNQNNGGVNGSYPTYSNQYGLGTQTGTSGASNGASGGSTGSASGGSTMNPAAFQSITPPASSNDPYGDAAQAYYPQNSGPSASSTTGFNPWSMTGEANSRIM